MSAADSATAESTCSLQRLERTLKSVDRAILDLFDNLN